MPNHCICSCVYKSIHQSGIACSITGTDPDKRIRQFSTTIIIFKKRRCQAILCSLIGDKDRQSFCIQIFLIFTTFRIILILCNNQRFIAIGTSMFFDDNEILPVQICLKVVYSACIILVGPQTVIIPLDSTVIQCIIKFRKTKSIQDHRFSVSTQTICNIIPLLIIIFPALSIRIFGIIFQPDTNLLTMEFKVEDGIKSHLNCFLINISRSSQKFCYFLFSRLDIGIFVPVRFHDIHDNLLNDRKFLGNIHILYDIL